MSLLKQQHSRKENLIHLPVSSSGKWGVHTGEPKFFFFGGGAGRAWESNPIDSATPGSHVVLSWVQIPFRRARLRVKSVELATPENRIGPSRESNPKVWATPGYQILRVGKKGTKFPSGRPQAAESTLQRVGPHWGAKSPRLGNSRESNSEEYATAGN